MPLAAVLVVWWRPHIFERIAVRGDRNAVLTWVLSRSTGWASVVAAAVGGGYIRYEGLARWVGRWLGGFELAERLSAYVFRNQVERHISRSSSARSLLPDADVQSLLPGSEPPTLMEDIEADSLALAEQHARAAGSVVVVVGEQGLGKSTFLRRLQDRLPPGTLRIGCPRTGFSGLIAELASELGVHGPISPASVREALRGGACPAVLIDDVHRLTQPSVGGLADFDRLLQLDRECGDATSWVLTFSSHAWAYVERARGIHGVDRVVELGPWSRVQIGALAQARSAQLGIRPSFEELVVPRSFDFDDDPSESRLEGGFYRILWDYADGNPAVALHFWRRSIFRRDDGKVVVTLFDGPSSSDLDDLPPLLPFVLRTLAQLEEADAQTIATCANLGVHEVSDLLRLAERRGYVEQHADRGHDPQQQVHQ